MATLPLPVGWRRTLRALYKPVGLAHAGWVTVRLTRWHPQLFTYHWKIIAPDWVATDPILNQGIGLDEFRNICMFGDTDGNTKENQ